MYTFEEIVDKALTSREEVEMVYNAQIGAGHDITEQALMMCRDAVYQAFQAYRVQRFEKGES